MQSTDILNLFLIGAGNAVLVRQECPDFEDLSKLMGLSLKPDGAVDSLVRFKSSGGLISYVPWLEDQKKRQARSLRLVAVETLGHSSKSPPLEGIPETQLRGFDGTSNLVLAVLYDDHLEAWHARILYSRQTDLQVSDILTFLSQSPCANQLKGKMLWENAHNLHYFETEAWRTSLAHLKPNTGEDFLRSQHFESLIGYWEPFVRTVPAERVENFVETFGRCCGNAEIPENEGSRWFTLYDAHRQEQFRSYEYETLGSFGRSLPLYDVEEEVAAMHDVLSRIASYADTQGEKGWGDFFREGLRRLNHLDPDTQVGVVTPLRALKVPEDVIRVLSAALFVSDAFGGMGTWNDVPFYQEPDYERLSQELLKVIDRLFLAGASRL